MSKNMILRMRILSLFDRLSEYYQEKEFINSKPIIFCCKLELVFPMGWVINYRFVIYLWISISFIKLLNGPC